MRLRDEIQEIIRRPVEAQEAVLQSFKAGTGIPIDLETGMKILTANIEGMHEAILRLADEVEALADTP